jgi:hypothetical protein
MRWMRLSNVGRIEDWTGLQDVTDLQDSELLLLILSIREIL